MRTLTGKSDFCLKFLLVLQPGHGSIAPVKLLVIGSGGREHALVWKLAQSPHASAIWCAPGNAGIAGERLRKNGRAVECISLEAHDLTGLLAFAQEKQADLTVVGPDKPLALGIV